MKSTRMILAILLIAGGGFALNVAQAQQGQEMAGITASLDTWRSRLALTSRAEQHFRNTGIAGGVLFIPAGTPHAAKIAEREIVGVAF